MSDARAEAALSGAQETSNFATEDNGISLLKDEVVTRLQAKDEMRQSEAAKKRAERQETKDPKESYAHFSTVFRGHIDSVKGKLNGLSPDFEDIASEIRIAQKLVSDSTIFLVPHDVRTSQQTLKELETEMLKVKESVQPKKKFTFAKKKPSGTIPDGTESEKKAETEKKATASEPPVIEKVFEIGRASAGTNDVTDFDPNHSIIDQKDMRTVVNLSVIENHDVVLLRLENCAILLPARMTALRLLKLTNCMIYSGPISGSVYVEDCKDCEIRVASQQIRIHGTSNTDFYVFVRSNPIIEFCKDVRFAPYQIEYENLELDFKACSFESNQNKWNLVNDFRWLHPTQSPNWSILPEEKRKLPDKI